MMPYSGNLSDKEWKTRTIVNGIVSKDKTNLKLLLRERNFDCKACKMSLSQTFWMSAKEALSTKTR